MTAGSPIDPKIDPTIDPARALAETRAWVELAVVGLNLCPFAKAPWAKGRIRYRVSEAAEPAALLEALCEELDLLAASDAEAIETTLLIHPLALTDFADFNDFLAVADAALEDRGLEGVLQIASFHPHYQFAGTDARDIGNATNRSPHPTLHLLREDSISRAVAAFPEAEDIFEANIRTLEALGATGWSALQAHCRQAGGPAGALPETHA